MWPRYVVKDDILNEKHFNIIKNISFDTKPDEWDIYKHKIFNDGKIEIGFQSSSGKEGISPLSEEDIKQISKLYQSVIFLDTKKILGDWAHDIDFIKINYHEYNRNKEVLENDPILSNKTIVTRGKYGCDYQGKNYLTSILFLQKKINVN